MFYTYVLRCRNGDLYVGSALDLRKRLAQHSSGRVRATVHRLPVKLECCEACHSELKARLRGRQLKTGHCRAYWKRRLEHGCRTPARNLSRSATGVAASRTRFISTTLGEQASKNFYVSYSGSPRNG